VWDVLAKTLLCEYQDFIFTKNLTDAFFGAANFHIGGQGQHLYSHNSPNSQFSFSRAFARANWLRGIGLNEPQYPSELTDFVRGADSRFRGINYNAEFYSDRNNYQRILNQVWIAGLQSERGKGEFRMPLIYKEDYNGWLTINLNLENEEIAIQSGGPIDFQGNVNEFFASPPSGYQIENETGRLFSKILGAKTIQMFASVAFLYYMSHTIANGMYIDTKRDVSIYDQTGLALSGVTAEFVGGGGSVASGSGTGEFDVTLDGSGLVRAPFSHQGYLKFSHPDAINSPLKIPIIYRLDPGVPDAVHDPSIIPERTELVGNYPNPFNPSTTVQFSLNTAEHVRLELFDALGRKIRTLVDSERPAGQHTISWNATDENGVAVANGVYFYRMTAGNYVQARKMLLIK
jgi:hypothetical protein